MGQPATSRRVTLHLYQEFRHRLPIVFAPPFEESFSVALRKTSVVENDFGSGSAVRELELHKRVDSGFPVSRAPGLDNSAIGYKFDMPPLNQTAERLESAAHFRIN